MSNDVKQYDAQTLRAWVEPGQGFCVVEYADYAALKAERNELRRRLDAADEWATLASEQLKERDALAAELQALKAQEPIGWISRSWLKPLGGSNLWSPTLTRTRDDEHDTQLYAAPPAAQDVSALPPFAEKVLAKLRRFEECAEDSDSGGVDIGRHWLDLLTQLALLNRVQRSPCLWEISQQGEDFLAAHRQAQQQDS